MEHLTEREFEVLQLVSQGYSNQEISKKIFVSSHTVKAHLENIYRKRKPKANDIDSITPKEALIVGVAQCFAMWPGMSRSASTIMGGCIAGLSTPIAAEFSFFLAIPAMIGSSGLDMLKFDYSEMNSTKWIALAVGFIVAFIVSIVVMDKFVSYLKKKPMRVFAIYRVIVGVILAVLVFAGFMTLPAL